METIGDTHDQILLARKEAGHTLYAGTVVSLEVEGRGPVRKRPCSDCLCLLILMGFVGLLAYTVSYSIENNHVQLFLSGVDVDANSCGVTPGFEEFSAVYYMAVPETDPITQEITYTLNAVCVSKCPAEETDIVDCRSDSIACPSTPIDPD